MLRFNRFYNNSKTSDSMSSHKSDDKAAGDIPELLVDSKKGVTYRRLRFFGKVISIFTIFLEESALFIAADYEVCLAINARPFFISVV